MSSAVLSPSAHPSRSDSALHPRGMPSEPVNRPQRKSSLSAKASTQPNRDEEWGNNFWITLVDPQTETQFFACPSTGECTWDAPVGNFVLPPSNEGEWWELADETRDGLSYYYHTKTNETTWEKPEGFVIPLRVIQNTTLGRRISQSTRRGSKLFANDGASKWPTQTRNAVPSIISERSEGPTVTPNGSSPASPAKSSSRHNVRRSISDTLPTSHRDEPPSPSMQTASLTQSHTRMSKSSTPPTVLSQSAHRKHLSGSRSRSKSSSHLPRAAQERGPHNPQSLIAATESIIGSSSEAESPPRQKDERRDVSGAGGNIKGKLKLKLSNTSLPPSGVRTAPSTPSGSIHGHGHLSHSPTTPLKSAQNVPRRPIPALPSGSISSSGRPSMSIGRPVLDAEATRNMNPVGRDSKPIPVPTKRLSTGDHPILPRSLVSEIQQFAASDFAKRYFSTHKEGLIFRRKVPVERMMVWQKGLLASPLLVINNRSLNKEAVKIFKVIQRIMGDREGGSPASTLEEERWLIGMGISHGELRDEIYCQVMKQLSGNTNTNSIFKGWQLLCVLLASFPPSKNFETYLRSWMKQRTDQTEGRVDVMAKYCLRKLAVIARKGPRGKPPTVAEIESAMDAAFNPSTFGESLDAIFRLQERSYPAPRIPIVLPFLADGILALGGLKQEGIFRVPGDSDVVSDLRLRIDKGFYDLSGIDDPHVPASLLKLWLRELQDPLVPAELYNECVVSSDSPEKVVNIVRRLPTVNRRVVLFVISFLQVFLDDKVMRETKMTAANLALVMAPNLLRCEADSMAVVFTNAQYEQKFVHNLLLHLRCDEADPDYVPEHGKGAVPTPTSRRSQQKSRRPRTDTQ